MVTRAPMFVYFNTIITNGSMKISRNPTISRRVRFRATAVDTRVEDRAKYDSSRINLSYFRLWFFVTGDGSRFIVHRYFVPSNRSAFPGVHTCTPRIDVSFRAYRQNKIFAEPKTKKK